MNNKEVKIHIYQQLNLKYKLSKQETESGIWRVCDGCQMGRGCGGMGEEVRGLRSTNR